ncbi:hypothetical protein [Streptomyces sp. RerS4]|uniref:hypothetical protein n=1 Tax=Streptomyces sp. RerS4 TaxID=2942449 RepID=UPI00201BF43C|nr:hypothetical protein [Streptomyces sp. RerS4]UQX04730.1 hypothetical protein M4D82_32650 [Streptomyces sp. RerS4]
MLPYVLFAVVFVLALRYTIKAARLPDIPPWRRFLPLVLLLSATVASLLRSFDVSEPADLIAFPFNIAAIVLAGREIAAHRARTAATG